MQTQVAEFHKKFKSPIQRLDNPKFPDRPELRAKLNIEETLEMAAALVGTNRAIELMHDAIQDLLNKNPDQQPDTIETIDAMGDILFVTFGTAVEMGVDLELYFDEIHRSNMAKEGGGNRSDGKILKPAGWTKPDIKGVLEAQKKMYDESSWWMESYPLLDTP